MKKQHIIALIVAIAIIIIICLAMILSGNKSGKSGNTVSDQAVDSEIDWNSVKVTTIKFNIKNSTGKNIVKIYAKNNRMENYSDEISGEIKNEEEKECSYGNYSPLYSWDMKIVFEDETEKTLNAWLAANELYNGATIELTDLEDTVSAINHNMGNPIVEESQEEVLAEPTEQANPESGATEGNPAEATNTVENAEEVVEETPEVSEETPEEEASEEVAEETTEKAEEAKENN